MRFFEASRPYSMPPLFFKHYWNIVKMEAVSAMQFFFTNKYMFFYNKKSIYVKTT